MKSQFQSIVEEYGIRSERIDMHSIAQKEKEETRRDCLIIETKDQDVSNWSNAANQLQTVLSETTLTPGTFQVEIRNPDLFYADRSSILPDDPDLISCIQAIRDQVLQMALRKLGKNCTSIGYHSRKAKWDKSPAKPSVLIFVRPGTLAVWEDVERSLLQAIRGDEFPEITLSLEILVGEVHIGAARGSTSDISKGLRYLELENMVPFNGSSIGVPGRSPDSGTLGGWLRLESQETGENFCGFLTCYHAIAMGDEENVLENNTCGIGLCGKNSQHVPKIEVVWPSEYDREAWKSEIQTLIEQGEASNSERNILAMLSQAKTSESIGSVRFASGFEQRTKSGARLDWAFVESPKTFRRNTPPPPQFNQSLIPGRNFVYAPTGNDFVHSLGRIKPGDWVVRQGRTSIGHGQVNRIQRHVIWEEHPPSEEVEIMGFGDDFGRAGDSGSWVVNRHFELVGMLIGMDRASSEDVGLVTPIHDIIDDIEKRTSCVVSFP
ncbi:hypothetical protein PZA11_006345 [Diplocarpon coronariae]